MIHASVYGRLGSDPVPRAISGDKVMVTTSMAVDAARHGEDAQTLWLDVVAFGKIGDLLMRHAKGDLLSVMGTVTQRGYIAKDGNERKSLSIVAQAIVSARTSRPGGGGRKSDSGPATGDRASQHPNTDGGGSGPDDEIPF